MILYKCTLFSFSKKAKSVGKTLCLFYLTRKLNEWKQLNTVTGKTEVTLPDKYSELFVIVYPGGDLTTGYTFTIPKACLSDTARNFTDGYSIFIDMQYSNFFRITVSNTMLVLSIARTSSGSTARDVTSTTKLEIYYK